MAKVISTLLIQMPVFLSIHLLGTSKQTPPSSFLLENKQHMLPDTGYSHLNKEHQMSQCFGSLRLIQQSLEVPNKEGISKKEFHLTLEEIKYLQTQARTL